MTNTKNAWRSWRAPSFYLPLEDRRAINPEEWDACPSCNEKPRLWIFDHGEFAKCKCQDTYEAAAAEGISIWDYNKAHNGDMTNWSHDDLKNNWNKYVKKQQP